MKRIYDIVDLYNMSPADVPRDLKMEVEFLERGVAVVIRDLHGNVISEGGLDIPTLIGFGRRSQLLESRNNSRPGSSPPTP